jgi:HNH endonuclease
MRKFHGIRGVVVPMKDRFWEKVKKTESCWNWIGAVRPNGYGVIRADGPREGGRTLRAHRVAWLLTYGSEPPTGLDLMHSCDNRRCVNPAHLEPGTRLKNMRDASTRGRTRRGETHPTAKLTEAQVIQIIDQFMAGIPSREIAESFSVSTSNVYQITSGRRWKHIQPTPKQGPLVA